MTLQRLSISLVLLVFACSACTRKSPDVASEAPAQKSVLPGEPSPSASSTPAQAVPGVARMASIELGSAVGPDDRVSEPTATYSPKDTIFAVVEMRTGDPAATAAGTLKVALADAKGRVLSEQPRSATFNDGDMAVFEFGPDAARAPGAYKITVQLDQGEVQVREFDVR